MTRNIVLSRILYMFLICASSGLVKTLNVHPRKSHLYIIKTVLDIIQNELNSSLLHNLPETKQIKQIRACTVERIQEKFPFLLPYDRIYFYIEPSGESSPFLELSIEIIQTVFRKSRPFLTFVSKKLQTHT